jgi:hypothetical protein
MSVVGNIMDMIEKHGFCSTFLYRNKNVDMELSVYDSFLESRSSGKWLIDV